MNFEKLTAYLDSLKSVGIPGCDVAIWQAHRPIYRHLAGHRDSLCTQPMLGDETYWLYSLTKVLTATCIMRLREDGKIDLEDPVARYLPAYKQMRVRRGENIVPAQASLTIRHLLTMQGGLDYVLDAPEIEACLRQTRGKATTREIVDALAARPLHFEPGSHFLYSLCHDVLGGVIEAVSGQTFGEYMRENIFYPLEMFSMSFRRTPELAERMAARFIYNMADLTSRPDSMGNVHNKYVLSSAYESGGAGLIGDVEDYMRFADALANDGIGWNGYRLLSSNSIDEMRTDQLEGASRVDFLQFNRLGYSYALGVRTLVDGRMSRSPVGEFGWDSAAGGWVLVDVERRLSAFYAQHVLECGYSHEVIHPTVRDLIYEGLDS